MPNTTICCGCGRNLVVHLPTIRMLQLVARGAQPPRLQLRPVGTELPAPDLHSLVRFRCDCGQEHGYPVEAPTCGA